jgi:hypothetical protein
MGDPQVRTSRCQSASVLLCLLASLGNVPKHSGWIPDVGDPKAPRLHSRRARRLDFEFSRQIKPTNVRPPSVQIIDHELHHEISRPLLLIIVLKDEAAGTYPEDRHIFVQKFFKAQRLVKALRKRIVFRRYEWASDFCSARNSVHLDLPSNPDRLCAAIPSPQ